MWADLLVDYSLAMYGPEPKERGSNGEPHRHVVLQKLKEEYRLPSVRSIENALCEWRKDPVMQRLVLRELQDRIAAADGQ